jgi:class 3 adenylate cyclase/pimeloyl-ACP methyl ester carboxylesterase
MADAARTRYAKCDGVDIAYQVLSDGPIDLLLYSGLSIPIDCMDQEPALARYLRRLASFGRLIRFDRRGIGLSDRGSTADPPTHERWAADGLAVLDAVGSERAVVIAPYLTAPDGLILAARAPERVDGLILIQGAARWMADTDYPHGISWDWGNHLSELSTEPDAVERGMDTLGMIAPQQASNAAFREWFDRAGNLAASPSMARLILGLSGTVDVRALLPGIQTRSLVICRTDNTMPGGGPENSRYLAAHLPHATLVELPGDDVLYWLGDAGPMLDEIEEFITGVRGGSGIERVLTTMLFTDIVGSTGHAARLGDNGWRNLLEHHDRVVRLELARFRGREVKNAGDGFLAIFDGPSRAIECARSVRTRLRELDLEVRAGIHTGEVEVRGDDIAGMGVHVGARVAATAGPGEILVSSGVPVLVSGSATTFTDRGERELKGVPGRWRLYSVDG